MATEGVVENGLGAVKHASAPTADVPPSSSTMKTPWKTKYLTLKAKCDQLDQSNDVLYAKSRQICKMIQIAESEKRVLMRRLEQYEVDIGESSSSSVLRLKMANAFTSPPPSCSFPHSSNTPNQSIFTSPASDPTDTEFVRTLRQDIATSSTHLTNNTNSPSHTTAPITTSTHTVATQQHPPASKKARISTPTRTTSSSPVTKPTKKASRGTAKSSPASRRKKDSDSGAPKKPSNAFFWFCQEQRGSLEEQFRGEGVAGQHSLTKILAQKWGETTTDDKKKYYVRYNEDKKRYEREMQVYHKKKHEQQLMIQEQLSSSLAAPDTNTNTHQTTPTQ